MDFTIHKKDMWLFHNRIPGFSVLTRQTSISESNLQAWPWLPFTMFSPEHFWANHQRFARKLKMSNISGTRRAAVPPPPPFSPYAYDNMLIYAWSMPRTFWPEVLAFLRNRKNHGVNMELVAYAFYPNFTLVLCLWNQTRYCCKLYVW